MAQSALFRSLCLATLFNIAVNSNPEADSMLLRTAPVALNRAGQLSLDAEIWDATTAKIRLRQLALHRRPTANC